MESSVWQFWIDVGGTFTDCIACRPDGSLQRCKVLSSGVSKGRVRTGSSSRVIADPLRRSDPAGFWAGYECRLLDANGATVACSQVERFDQPSVQLHLDTPLDPAPVEGQSYELASPEEAPLLAMRRLLQLPLQAPLPACAVRLGTTRGTNALLTRGGAPTGLVTTAGFADVLRIGNQSRPQLFALDIELPEPLYQEVAEIAERITWDGEVLLQPRREQVVQQLLRLKQAGIQSLAICLLNAYQNGRHEEFVAQVARELGFRELSLSSHVAPLIKIVARGDTTVVDAYLNPVLAGYVGSLRQSMGGGSELRLLTSAGGLVGADQYHGKDSILSGPAGGVVGFSRIAAAAGFERAIGFDMGGTSTDVSRFDGRYELEFEAEKAGVRVVSPMLAIETVAAGGGSVCHFDGVKLAVGPDSAGADPGPACYGRGGPLAITDVNFALGKILPEYFPFPLDREAVEARLASFCQEIERATGHHYQPLELASGFLRVANANMVKAIRSISIAKGYDPKDYVLVAFGGAASQHACDVARQLGIKQILNHPDAGLLSAYGIGMADMVRHGVIGAYTRFTPETAAELRSRCGKLAAELNQELRREGVPDHLLDNAYSLDLRYQGTDASLNVPWDDVEDGGKRFRDQHRRLYGYVMDDRDLEIVSARVECVGRAGNAPPASRRLPPRPAKPIRTQGVVFGSEQFEASVYRRRNLEPGHFLQGPAIVVEAASTTVIDPGWQAQVLSAGELLLWDASTEPTGAAAPNHSFSKQSPPADPVSLEIFNNLFAGTAEQMGLTLRNTASSVNVKERLDFSCAVFTGSGQLVVNAPHIPVHLGAMSETVKCVIQDNPRMRPGDVFVTNDPYRGGSHLPDITVVTPVHDDRQELIFFTASRAHHAEIGGTTPGSMPPFSRNLAEEGVVIRNFKLVDAGVSRWNALRQLLLDAPYPTRNVNDNLADISAQVAANQQGARDLKSLIERLSWETVSAYMHHIQQAAERKMRGALSRLAPGRREFVDHLDDGSRLAVAVTIEDQRARIDFTGTDPVLRGNLNANRAIVAAAVMYCMRCLIDEDIPLNEGVMEPMEIVLPPCLLNPTGADDPQRCPAVAGGNVETSQRVVDVLLGALGVAGASQGTMNNVSFGDDSFGYYETICGGAGATARAPGADAVHTHMTNTRITDPEVLERRYPARVLQFSIRRDSGGIGRHRGGHGVVRRLQFLKPLEVSLLSQRRGEFPPYGIRGGQPGRTGQNRLESTDGSITPLPGICRLQTQPGDILCIETPGGGGWGAAE